MPTNYVTMPMADIRAELQAVADDVQATFGPLDMKQLNWRPEATRWSVAQVLDHVMSANRQMMDQAAAAQGGARPQSIWMKLPIWPGLMGRTLIKAVSPQAARKVKASPLAQPTASAIDPGIVARFIGQQRDLITRASAFDEQQAARLVMTSPFLKVITYSVLDGWRIIVAHERRHVEQGRRVIAASGFPR
jgi:hypothetical protein